MSDHPAGAYDRPSASRILGGIAAAGLFGAAPDRPRPAARIPYTSEPLAPEPGSHLTAPQLDYLHSAMRPCRPEQVSSATERIGWTDSAGLANVGHCGPSQLGPVVPIAVREAVLALWERLAVRPAAVLEPRDAAVLT